MLFLITLNTTADRLNTAVACITGPVTQFDTDWAINIIFSPHSNFIERFDCTIKCEALTVGLAGTKSRLQLDQTL